MMTTLNSNRLKYLDEKCKVTHDGIELKRLFRCIKNASKYSIAFKETVYFIKVNRKRKRFGLNF